MTSPEQQLEDRLVEWELARLEGRPISATEVCADAPHLVEALEQRIAVLEKFAWVANPELRQLLPPDGDDTRLPDTDVTVAEFMAVLTSNGLLGRRESVVSGDPDR